LQKLNCNVRCFTFHKSGNDNNRFAIKYNINYNKYIKTPSSNGIITDIFCTQVPKYVIQVLSSCKETVPHQCAVPTSEKFIVQLSTFYSRHDVILQWCCNQGRDSTHPASMHVDATM